MAEVMTRDLTATVAAYFAMWNEEDETARLKHIAEAWTEDGRYSDPQRDAKGHTALSQMVAEARPHFPGHSVRLTSGIDAHHESIRFAWEVVGPDGSVPVAGIDIGVVAPDGRLRQITGFFGEIPSERS